MFVPCDLQPNEIGYVKIIKTDKVKDNTPQNPQNNQKNSLSIEGITND